MLTAALLVLVFFVFQICFSLGQAKETPLTCRAFPEKEKSFFEKFFGVVWAATINPGSIFTVCTHTISQPDPYTSESDPSITVSWTFSSPVGNTQQSYRVQIDDNSDFGSVVVDTGMVADELARSYTSNSGLAFETNYYWRLMLVDNNNSTTDWVVGDAFQTGSPSSDVLNSQAKEQEINLQTTISSRSYE